MKNFYVYAHYTKENELFYIGKGKDNRAHSKAGRNAYWKNIVNKYGYYVKILSKDLIEEESFTLEIMAIELYNPKANLTQGGFGGNTSVHYNKDRMERFKEKCSKSKIEFWNSKSSEYKKNHVLNGNIAVRKYWAEMDPEVKRQEQRRRVSLKIRKKVKCLNNNKIYNCAKEACKDLNLTSPTPIRECASGKKYSYFNYKFKYVT